MKFCFSTLGCPERSLDEVLELARTYRITALELRGLEGTLDHRSIVSLSPQSREETLKKFQSSGVVPWILGTSCKFNDQTTYDSYVREGYEAIDLAQSLGFRGIRVFGNNVKGDEGECIRRVCKGIRALCEYAADKGVDVLLETHGDFNTPERLDAVCACCREYGNFGLIWDVCHTRKTYGDAWRDLYRTFGGLVRHVHLKDVEGDRLVLPGKGELPLVEMINELTAHGYDGFFSLEWEKKWHPELPDIEQALDALLELPGLKQTSF